MRGKKPNFMFLSYCKSVLIFQVFEELLLDADWSLNAGNWMWLSASSFFYQYYRVYSPIAFGKKTDPNGDYIRKYLPQLKKFPKEYIYEPWKAPMNVQKGCGVIIGQDYPKPIVVHEEISKVNIQRMKAAYANQPNASNGAAPSKPSTPAAKRKSSDKKDGPMNKFLKKK